MRGVVVAASLVVLLGLSASGCDADDEATPVGCGFLQRSRVVGLVGADATATVTGSVEKLRTKHRALSCTNVDPQDEARTVRVTAEYHPEPYRLPSHSCDQGWVVAGSIKKNAPACQEGVSNGGRTRLIVRWQPYLVRVTVTRPDRDWAGDPEIALAMSRDLARRLGVAEAAGDS